MKRIALSLLLVSAAVGQSRNPRTQTVNVTAGHQVTSHMVVSCVVTPSAVVSVPLVILNTNDDLQTWRRPQENSTAHGPTGWP